MAATTFDDVFAALARIVGDAMRVDAATLTPQTNLIFDLGAESLDLVDIRFRMEEAFGFQIDQRAFVVAIAGDVPGGDVSTMLTLQRVVEFVLRHQSREEQ